MPGSPRYQPVWQGSISLGARMHQGGKDSHMFFAQGYAGTPDWPPGEGSIKILNGASGSATVLHTHCTWEETLFCTALASLV